MKILIKGYYIMRLLLSGVEREDSQLTNSALPVPRPRRARLLTSDTGYNAEPDKSNRPAPRYWFKC